LAFPVFAQQQNAPDPQLREQLLAFVTKYEEAINNSDAAAAASFFAGDGVLVNNTGPIYGQKAIEKYYAGMFQNVHFSNYIITVDQNFPQIIGKASDEAWSTGGWSSTDRGQNLGPVEQKGYWSVIDTREGDARKIRMLTWNITPAPAATPSQQTNTPDPKLREQILACSKQYDDAFNNNDAFAVATHFTEDAVLVNDDGPVYGREAIEKLYENVFKMVRFTNHVSTLDQYSPHIIGTAGNEMWGNGEWSHAVQGQNFGPLDEKGYWTTIYACEGDVWKMRFNTWNRLEVYSPPPNPAKTNIAPTSSQEQKAVDPEVRQQIEAIETKFQEAYNNRDLAAIGALLTQDAIEVRSWPAEYRGGLASGRQAIEKRFEADFATNPGKMVNKLVQLYPIGNAICEITNSNVGGWKAQTATIYVRDGNTWKPSMTYVNNQQMWLIHRYVSRLKPHL
jgi:ketosteroid isomerase-like protein